MFVKPKNNLSHVIGARRQELFHQTIPQFLDRITAQHKNQIAAIFHDENITLTYQQLSQKINHLATALLQLGLKPKDKIAIWSPNRHEWLLAQYASAKIGIILVAINPAYRKSELQYALNKTQCRALILTDKFKNSNYIKMLQELAPELQTADRGQLQAENLPHLKIIIQLSQNNINGMFRFKDIMINSPDENELDKISQTLKPDDPINIQFTSGTTGAPKGATLSHKNIINNAHFVTQALNLSENDRLCIPVPLYHCFGMVMASLGCVSKGATMVFPGESFDPLQTLSAIDKYQCTAIYSVPTMFVSMLDHNDFKNYDVSHLRTGIMAGAPCPIEIMQRVMNEMNLTEITIAYGMTETSPVSFQSAPDDPIEMRVKSVGRIQPFVEAKIVNGKGETVAVGEQGELWVKGYNVMCGYYGDQTATDAAIIDGWMHTGDIAVLNERGYCRIVGRIKDMIIRGGENIYPREIEDFLFTHPKIQQAEVFGVPHEKWGEEVCAWIILHEGQTATAQEIKEFCHDQIAHYKIPQHIKFVKSFPLTVTGKPQKYLMRRFFLSSSSCR